QVDNDLQRNIVNSDEDLKDKLSPYDLSCFKKQILISNKSNFYVQEKNICPDVTLTTQKKEDRKISETLIKPFSSILKDNLQSVEYIQSNKDD
ncbi:pathogenicity determinant protein PdpA1, partial [Francisella tularensis subsp. holarctica]|nr:pathogenicity determinant protein PdpA1 [Francisella tularensis subsp. holarctica]